MAPRFGALWTALAIAAVLAAAPKEKHSRSDQLTGCVDERPGPAYVLLSEDQLQVLARLEPEGFAAQSFARFLGHKVTVTGRLEKNAAIPTIKVKSIKEISTTCSAGPRK